VKQVRTPLSSGPVEPDVLLPALFAAWQIY